MTYMDKLRKEHPEDVSPAGYASYCPKHYGYSDESAYAVCPAERGLVANCLECWNREMPEEKGFAESFANIAESATRAAESIKNAIKDSGERREFSTGAVRDIQDGKGRCDLMPLDVVGEYICEFDNAMDDVLWNLNMFQTNNSTGYLYPALYHFEKIRGWDRHTLILEAAKHFEDGAKKYGEWNWQKGIPTHCYIDSAVRHYLKWLRGDSDEPHDRAFVWNILCCIWTCIHKPELNDYEHKTGG